MSERIFNPKKYQALRTELRNVMPEPERHLWRHIRGRQLGVKFRRQHGVGSYIVDFYCPEKHLVIEVDGDSHYTDEARKYDIERTIYLNRKGLQVLLFTNEQVMNELDAVLNVILGEIS
ncbi:endonuclease domain-containing protein [Marinomonas foliarum]|uniref:Endonuclease domain-containing protein n=1 Tax=Marinomonas foliarum TaxID=491950 RepID=A0ABX7IW86_9GAMM|nr:endonuclease domain-containing protein [Marinomonas foliarum]QRV25157.1 endonuclease domain-containing protein [Marinomonas foliarum]